MGDPKINNFLKDQEREIDQVKKMKEKLDDLKEEVKYSDSKLNEIEKDLEEKLSDDYFSQKENDSINEMINKLIQFEEKCNKIRDSIDFNFAFDSKPEEKIADKLVYKIADKYDYGELELEWLVNSFVNILYKIYNGESIEYDGQAHFINPHQIDTSVLGGFIDGWEIIFEWREIDFSISPKYDSLKIKINLSEGETIEKTWNLTKSNEPLDIDEKLKSTSKKKS